MRLALCQGQMSSLQYGNADIIYVGITSHNNIHLYRRCLIVLFDLHSSESAVGKKMPPSKASIISLVVPIVVAAFITRPPIIEDYAKQVVGSLQNVNRTVEVLCDKFNQVVHSSWFRFCLAYLVIAVLTYCAVQLYKAFTEPLAIYSDEAKTAYFVDGPAGGKTKDERVNEFRKHRRLGDIPPVYPNGWMAVLMSSELQKKEPKFVHVAGKHLAVFRGESSRAYIVDAYCAHLGANLAVGGSVHGDCIECPFHGWRYRGDDGKCVKIGYTDKIPESANIPTYHCCEVNKRIFFWHHAEGKEPDWEVPSVDEIANGTMKPVGFTVAEYNGLHQDVFENTADMAHLDYIHAPRGFTGRSTFEEVGWAPDPTRKHVATMYVKNKPAKLFGFIPLPSTTTYPTQIGPCFSHIEINKRTIGRLVFVLSTTPIGPMRQRMVITGFCEGNPFSFYMGKRLLHELFYQIEGDIPMFANKTYIRNAILVKEEHLITKYRRFHSQFYSENSPKYKESTEW